MQFYISIDPPLSAIQNMQKDEKTFLQAESAIHNENIHLRFYTWAKPSISFGYSQQIEKLLEVGKAKEAGIDLVKRITGGGIVLHQSGELTYCLVAPLKFFNKSIIESCNQISRILIRTLQQLNITAELASRKGLNVLNNMLCFARPAKYEVLVQGRKLIGSAQKRGRNVLMQHGSVLLEERQEVFKKIIDVSELEASQTNIKRILGRSLDYMELSRIIKNEFLPEYRKFIEINSA